MILNLGPRPNSSKCFSICHCNLNNITSHSFIKVSLLSAYNAVHNFDMVLGKLPPTHFPPNLILTLILNQTLTLTGGQFSLEAIFRTPFDIICISESYLNSQILSNDDKLSIPGYNMFRADIHRITNVEEFAYIIRRACSQFRLSQIVKKATHISQSFSSCINLLFTNQTNLVTDSGVHPSLHSNCHHQIVYAKFNLKIKFCINYLMMAV